MDGGLALLFWLLVALACWLAWNPEPCADPGCRFAHRAHEDHERRQRIASEHALHYTPNPDCDRCRGRE